MSRATDAKRKADLEEAAAFRARNLEEKKKEIRKLLAEGLAVSAIARRVGVANKTVIAVRDEGKP